MPSGSPLPEVSPVPCARSPVNAPCFCSLKIFTQRKYLWRCGTYSRGSSCCGLQCCVLGYTCECALTLRQGRRSPLAEAFGPLLGRIVPSMDLSNIFPLKMCA